MEKHRWKVYQWRNSGQWTVWFTGWRTLKSLRFDTWQQAIDFVNGKGET